MNSKIWQFHSYPHFKICPFIFILTVASMLASITNLRSRLLTCRKIAKQRSYNTEENEWNHTLEEMQDDIKQILIDFVQSEKDFRLIWGSPFIKHPSGLHAISHPSYLALLLYIVDLHDESINVPFVSTYAFRNMTVKQILIDWSISDRISLVLRVSLHPTPKSSPKLPHHIHPSQLSCSLSWYYMVKDSTLWLLLFWY